MILFLPGSTHQAQIQLCLCTLHTLGKVKSAIMLLDIGSKVNGTDLVKDTPLHLALRANHAFDIAIQLTSVLLQYGASPTLLGREDDMPLDIARQTGQGYCLELLEAALGENTYHDNDRNTEDSQKLGIRNLFLLHPVCLDP